MTYLALGFAALALLLWAGRSSRPSARALRALQWRFLAGGLAIACFSAAAFLSMRGGWGKGIVLFVIGLWMATMVRMPRLDQAGRSGAARPSPGESMSLAEARSMLGVGEEATRAEIEDAYKRLMRRVHPDQGGATGLAAQLNAARDRLLGR